MGRGGYPSTRPYLSGYPIIGYPLICGAGKGQKMANLQGAGRISQMVNGTGTRPAPTHFKTDDTMIFGPDLRDLQAFFFFKYLLNKNCSLINVDGTDIKTYPKE